MSANPRIPFRLSSVRSNLAPHRIGHLARMLDLPQDRGDTIFMTGGRIADWFVAADAAAQGSKA